MSDKTVTTAEPETRPGLHLRHESGDEPQYLLKLFVTGSTPRSLKAIANLRGICEEHLPGRYELLVVDLYQQPELAKDNKLVAAPTLIKCLPEPVRRVIGDMSDISEVLVGLDIDPN